MGRSRARPAKAPTVPGRPRPAPAARDDAAVVAGVRITHPDRVVYPGQGVTKRALAQFYAAIAEHALPHLRSRPTALVRCPEGLARECFYQKHAGPWAPPSLRRVAIREKTKTADYLVVEDVAGLVGLIQMGILEIHTWNARAERLEAPDRLVFDLDPDPRVPWQAVVMAARLVRARLLAEGRLESFVKTTGGKGLHVVVPIDPGPSWTECLTFARRMAEELVRETPRAFTATMAKAARPGRIFLDYFRNQRGATSVAAYSTRARPGAPVSTPLAWDELDAVSGSNHYTIANLERRLARLPSDPWTGYETVRQALPRPEGISMVTRRGAREQAARQRPAIGDGAATARARLSRERARTVRGKDVPA